MVHTDLIERNPEVMLGKPVIKGTRITVELIVRKIAGGYSIDELPRSAKVSFNGNDGVYQYQIEKTNNTIHLRSVVKLSKASYKASEYSNLREFFTYVVKKQQEQIVFRKKKA